MLALASAVAALVRIDPGGRAEAARQGAGPPVTSRPAVDPPAPKARPASAARPASYLYVPSEGGYSSSYYGGPPLRFRDLFPAQTRATIDPAIPATNYWALLIGINDYAGSTRDNVGSYQDARDLRVYLLNIGWRNDHIALIANRYATASMILQGISWLASKTNSASTVVFNYSGHEEPKYYGGTRHIMLWASDNRFIADTVFARDLGYVTARQMWINLAVCRAGGFNDPGLVQSGRVVTFSSPESELSYEDPSVSHSVMGWYIIMEAMAYDQADANGDGQVTVEEAFAYARPRVVNRTHGAQHPFMVDRHSGAMSLIPPKPAPPPADPPQSQPTSGCSFVICGGAIKQY